MEKQANCTQRGQYPVETFDRREALENKEPDA